MPRPCQRACLEQGLNLDINRLARNRFVRRGGKCAHLAFRWSGLTPAMKSPVASLRLTWSTRAGFESRSEAWISGSYSSQDPSFRWTGYFVCPVMNRYSSVLWKPPGANRFCSRQTWRRQVAYASKFADPDHRAHIGQAKIKSRLIADFDPDECDLPPKPKWMRWRTYDRYVELYDTYDVILTTESPNSLQKLPT